MSRLIVACLALFLAACASSPRAPTTSGVGVEEYKEFLSELRVAINDGIPREFNEREVANYNRVDGKLREMLAGIDSIDDLDHSQRTALFNLHETLQAIVTGREEDRIMCRREAVVGTHFRATHCVSQAELRRHQREAETFMDNTLRSVWEPPTG